MFVHLMIILLHLKKLGWYLYLMRLLHDVRLLSIQYLLERERESVVCNITNPPTVLNLKRNFLNSCLMGFSSRIFNFERISIYIK